MSTFDPRKKLQNIIIFIGYSKVHEGVSLSISNLYIATVLYNEQHSFLVPVYRRCQKSHNAVFISQLEVGFV